MSEKATFYSRDPGADTAQVEDAVGKRQYNGPERRRENRRQQMDRRTEVRFELSKEDRRKNEGRREDDVKVKYW